jgi:hypothetical protein
LKSQRDADQIALRAAETKLEQASRGNMAGDETSLRAQLDDAKAKFLNCKTEAEQAAMAIAPTRDALNKKESESKNTKTG